MQCCFTYTLSYNLSTIFLVKIVVTVVCCILVIFVDILQVPESDAPASTSYIPPRLHSNAELEQICLVAFIGTEYINIGMSQMCKFCNYNTD